VVLVCQPAKIPDATFQESLRELGPLLISRFMVNAQSRIPDQAKVLQRADKSRLRKMQASLRVCMRRCVNGGSASSVEPTASPRP